MPVFSVNCFTELSPRFFPKKPSCLLSLYKNILLWLKRQYQVLVIWVIICNNKNLILISPILSLLAHHFDRKPLHNKLSHDSLFIWHCDYFGCKFDVFVIFLIKLFKFIIIVCLISFTYIEIFDWILSPKILLIVKRIMKKSLKMPKEWSEAVNRRTGNNNGHKNKDRQ